MFKDKKINKNWLYLLPAIIILTIFTFLPLTKVLIISFNSNYDKFSDTFGIKVKELFSLKNYINVLRDYEFKYALRNTFLLVLFVVPLSLILSLIIALLLNRIKNHFFKNIFKTFFFMPLISNTVIMGMIFSIIFYFNVGISSNKPEGLFNSFIKFFGFKPQEWIVVTSPFINKIFVLILYNIWIRLPFKIFVFLLAIQNIDKSYYNAAKIDGASKIRTFTKITLPLIKPIIFYQFIIEMLAIFKEYESIIGLFGDKPSYKIQTIVGYIYNQLSNSSFQSYSKGAAAAMILFFISILFTTISILISKKTEK
ncbi:MAG: sugar ABC transporter permease [Candidatus Phytoplasma stylosanthis]|uniref:carbohydrate ABC transporter permease n=1 Tax=Candidatus Phytoplasma stylosanthis TaxID=2798314 RepID=UPI002939E7DB|nr:sugar ABC transporter permease [Candidatus Phytoplasma stylosanthis]MDV3167812.1 sugar ABC transporter permease [Candidatus Phytoplasma stylosanthis]MDV3170911.1 sugar ABC transporter permease [Candidatus Phytoplasma stylosanthis]MDV3173589.1 sugar ABC transporter permease [Candidatus Phytoplasma stylosanthis]MDV3174091.1 sugar ABC transporter permease [Candidatus Phytoplasma stylosanthis]MDV3202397.1 sugar ABC transporter permease [Candidatus Phytoplasma stylosanthis]